VFTNEYENSILLYLKFGLTIQGGQKEKWHFETVPCFARMALESVSFPWRIMAMEWKGETEGETSIPGFGKV
jgi:hypothetical protein